MSQTVGVIEAEADVSMTDLTLDAVVNVGLDTTLSIPIEPPTTDIDKKMVLVAQNKELKWVDPNELIRQFFIDNNLEHILTLNELTTT